MESYNSGVLFGNSPEAAARELALMGINAETVGNKEKAQKLTRGEYLATALLFILDRRRYGELILSFKNNYTKQQRNYPRTLTKMYGLIVAFEPTRATLVTRGRNKGLNFDNVVVDSEGTRGGDHDGGSIRRRKLEC